MRGKQLIVSGMTQANTRNVIPNAHPNANAMMDLIPAMIVCVGDLGEGCQIHRWRSGRVCTGDEDRLL